METDMNTDLLWPEGQAEESRGALEFSPSLGIAPKAQQHLQEGLACLQSGDAEGAVLALSQSIECVPGCTAAHVFLGIAHALSNNIYPAIDHLEIATRLEPESFAAHYALAQLNFKLRIPQAGYEQAEQALRCPMTLEQRKMLTQLLREERARARSGISRPWFNKPFHRSMLFLAGSGMIAALIAVMVHMH
jgi:tetratricopeptide (TPR) repeat protein